jgi:hypothetical protein
MAWSCNLHVGQGQHTLGLGGGEDVPGQALFDARQFDVGGGIGQDVVVFPEPLEERADVQQVLQLAGEREWFAVVLAVVTLHDKTREGLRRGGKRVKSLSVKKIQDQNTGMSP